MKATRYEFTHKDNDYLIGWYDKKGWWVGRKPVTQSAEHGHKEILSVDGWVNPEPINNLRYFQTAEECYEELTAPTAEEIAAADREMDAFSKMSDYFSDRIRQLAIAKKGVSIEEADMDVIYSAYETDDNGVPVDNMDDVAAEGTFDVRYDGGWGQSTGTIGQPVTNPTWCELAVFADAAIKYSDDKHHVFFEGINVKDGKIELYFGS